MWRSEEREEGRGKREGRWGMKEREKGRYVREVGIGR